MERVPQTDPQFHDDDPYNFDNKVQQFDYSPPPTDDYFSLLFRTPTEDNNERNRVLRIVLSKYRDILYRLTNQRTTFVSLDSSLYRARYDSLMPLPRYLIVSPPESEFRDALYPYELYNPEYWMFWVYT